MRTKTKSNTNQSDYNSTINVSIIKMSNMRMTIMKVITSKAVNMIARFSDYGPDETGRGRGSFGEKQLKSIIAHI